MKVTKTQQEVTKKQPLTISKNPSRVAAGKRTAELMRQRKAEQKQVEPIKRLDEPWLNYALGGMAIVGVAVFFNRYFNNKVEESNKIPELSKQQPSLFMME